MVVKFINTICPPQPHLSLHRRAALSRIPTEHGPYIAERTQKAVYIVRCLWYTLLSCVIDTAESRLAMKFGHCWFRLLDIGDFFGIADLTL
jgi:hypothetical protein